MFECGVPVSYITVNNLNAKQAVGQTIFCFQKRSREIPRTTGPILGLFVFIVMHF